MFFGEGYNVPPCCDQKFFARLFTELREKNTVQIYMQADYSLARMLPNLLLHVPMANVNIMTTELHSDVASVLRTLMSRHWYNGVNNNSFMLENLLFIAPESTIDPTIANTFSIFGKRACFAKAETAHTAILVENGSFRCVFTGTISQKETTSKQCFTSMSVTCDKQSVDEFSTIFRILSHGKI